MTSGYPARSRTNSSELNAGVSARDRIEARIERYRKLELRLLRRTDADDLLRDCARAAAYVEEAHAWACGALNRAWQESHREAAEMHREIQPDIGELSAKQKKIRDARNRARAEAQRRREKWNAIAERALELAAGETGARKKEALVAAMRLRALADDDDVEKWLPRLPEEPEQPYPRERALLLHLVMVLPVYRGREEDIRELAKAEGVIAPAAISETVARWRKQGGYDPRKGYRAFPFRNWRLVAVMKR